MSDESDDEKKRREIERIARELGIRRAYEAAKEEWKIAALGCVWWCAERMYDFTAWNVWQRLKQVTNFVPKEKRAIAGVLARAKADGVIVPTTERRQSLMPGNHLNEIMVWKSRVYRPEPREPTQELLL